MPRRTGPGVRGDVAQALRTARGLTARDVVDQTGIDPSSLSLIEHGHRPGRPHLHTLAAVLGVTPDELSGQHPVIRVLREIKGYRPGGFAQAVGVTPARLARLESGAEHPDEALAERIAVRLGVKVSVVRPVVPEGEAA